MALTLEEVHEAYAHRCHLDSQVLLIPFSPEAILADLLVQERAQALYVAEVQQHYQAEIQRLAPEAVLDIIGKRLAAALAELDHRRCARVRSQELLRSIEFNVYCTKRDSRLRVLKRGEELLQEWRKSAAEVLQEHEEVVDWVNKEQWKERMIKFPPPRPETIEERELRYLKIRHQQLWTSSPRRGRS